MTISKHQHHRIIWVASIQFFLERLIPVPLIDSLLIFALPFIVAGLIIQHVEKYEIFTRGVVFGLLWLSIAPYLIINVYEIVDKFFDSNRSLFKSDDISFNEFRNRIFFDSGSPKHLFLSIPLTIFAIIILLISIYAGAPLIVKIWGCVTFGLLIYVAGIGFWGIFQLLGLIERICEMELNFNPYHSDKFGGLRSIGHLNIKIPLLFFSGSLMYPMIMDALDKFPKSEFMSIVFWLLIIFYLGLGFAGFLIPQFQIHDAISRYKEESLTNSEKVLQKLLSDLCLDDWIEKDKAYSVQIKINTYYTYFHERIMAVKEWLWDWKVLLQLVTSMVVPILIALFQTFIK
ncbi:MAG: hypothetical protein A2X25_00865 [Chloroflexi bacterium GWB2_49_20]|nr:MAG: hypothetical protein A2X25_00865 [Chloroflexi bacterium GWB2_49_20]OGN77537.1 MAG: hypothetical protein A2X26_02235 [Chloroflexi bacterium GWC2_49_37]OGN83200.1 MAG: hypothetical protein A2X27_13485 [Chloroflexi bacterium GWD2_49_16]